MARKKSDTKSDSSSISKAIRMCVDTGKVEFGMKGALSHSALGQGKLVIVSSNAPGDELSDLKKYCLLSSIALFEFDGTSRELGSLCGKPFLVSAMLVTDVGDSPIMNLVKK